MESSSDRFGLREARILRYKPRLSRQVGAYRREELLLPAYAWQVIIPDKEQPPLNILQRAVLRLLAAGVHAPARLSEQLGLDPDLLAILLAELQQRRLIQHNLETTPAGQKALEDALPSAEGASTAWVFQSALDGKLLPRIIEHLMLADYDIIEKGRPVLLSGSHGRPRRSRPFVLSHPQGFLTPTPSHHELQEVVRRHNHQHRNLLRSKSDLDGEEAATQHRAILTQMPRQRIFLYTFIAAYTQEAIQEGSPLWTVADPFGFGASKEIKKQLETRCNTDNLARKYIENIIGAEKEQLMTAFKQAQEQLTKQAEKRLENDLPWFNVLHEESIRAGLKTAFVEIERLELLSIDENRPLPAGEGAAAWLALRQALEQILGLLIKANPPGEVWRMFKDKDNPLSQEERLVQIQRAGEAVGFNVNMLPQSVSTVKPDALQNACRPGGSTFNIRPTLAALVLAASQNVEHPLRTIASCMPEWLMEIDRVATNAGGRIHGSEERLTLAMLNEDAQRTLRVTSTYLRGV